MSHTWHQSDMHGGTGAKTSHEVRACSMSHMEWKNDTYKQVRGGYARLLAVSCATCGTHLFYYQKDGPGIVKRLYLDRIYQSHAYAGLQHRRSSISRTSSASTAGSISGCPLSTRKNNDWPFGFLQVRSRPRSASATKKTHRAVMRRLLRRTRTCPPAPAGRAAKHSWIKWLRRLISNGTAEHSPAVSCLVM